MNDQQKIEMGAWGEEGIDREEGYERQSRQGKKGVPLLSQSLEFLGFLFITFGTARTVIIFNLVHLFLI